jgi:hypothetical protein
MFDWVDQIERELPELVDYARRATRLGDIDLAFDCGMLLQQRLADWQPPRFGKPH